MHRRHWGAVSSYRPRGGDALSMRFRCAFDADIAMSDDTGGQCRLIPHALIFWNRTDIACLADRDRAVVPTGALVGERAMLET